MVQPNRVRTLWHALESVNAVIYFCPEPRRAADGLGFKGFWMGYFAFRAAPLGPAGPGLVEATFYNFHRSKVTRALPDAWGSASPEAALDARGEAAARALRRLLPGGGADRLANSVVPSLTPCIETASGAGRPLFSANREVPVPPDPVAAVWQAATTLREHRGDGHVALLTGAGLDGCEALVLFAACGGVPRAVFTENRGWSTEEWNLATDRLCGRGLVTPDGAATDAGRRLHAEIEAGTDALAEVPYRCLDDGGALVLSLLAGPARQLAASGEIPFPNPIGLPTWDRRRLGLDDDAG
jgi:Helix-turn-helix family